VGDELITLVPLPASIADANSTIQAQEAAGGTYVEIVNNLPVLTDTQQPWAAVFDMPDSSDTTKNSDASSS